MKKIILITGSTDGIGKVCAKELIKQGHKVILHGRNEEKAKLFVEEINKEIHDADVDYVIADLLSYRAIKNMSDKLSSKYDHLDVLINNAGAVFSKDRVLTIDNEERTFQLNVFAPFLLTHLLLPLLKNSNSGRIIFEASGAHAVARKPDFEDMKSDKKYNAQGNYSLSKLYLIWMGQHFAKYLKEMNIVNVTANITHPGAVATDFGQNVNKGLVTDLIYKIGLLFMSKPINGARSEIYLAISNEVEGISGKYFNDKCKVTNPSQKWFNEENVEKIWNYCMNSCKDYL